MNMDPFSVLGQIKNLQATGEDYSDCISEQNLLENQEFHHCLIFILTTDIEGNEISDQDRLLVICFMKQYGFQFWDDEEFKVILPFLDNDILKNMIGQLIASSYNDFNELYDSLKDISNEFPSYFIQLIESFIDKYQLGEDYEEKVIETISQLISYTKTDVLGFDLHLESIKCIISLSRSIQNDEIQEQIAQLLLEVFVRYPISIETKPIFQEILEIRYSIEKVYKFQFNQKVLELADFFCQQGPAFGTDENSFLYYLSEIIFHIFRDYADILDEVLGNKKIESLVSILLLFCVYHTDEIENWTSDVEMFFSSNSNYLIPSDKKFTDEDENEEIDENFLYKESHELHEFIYSEFIKLESFPINETTNLLSLAIQISASMIGDTIQNYSTPLINLSSILFFFKLNEIEFDLNKYTETGDDILIIYFILYCSSKGIPMDDINGRIEYFLAQESEMYHLLCTSILINYNTDVINPDLYPVCFEKCLKTISSFNTEEVTGVMNLLFSLADFENKPEIIPKFENIMGNTMDFLVSNLLLYQNAYQSTKYMCKLIAHFIHYINFQDLLSHFFSFINNLCSNAFYAFLGIQLENAFLNCKSSCNSFTTDQMNEFHHIFKSHLQIFDLDYICDNPSIIPPILSISYFFAKNSLIEGIEEWIFCVFRLSKIPCDYFDKISPLVISFIQNDSSLHRFEILKIMIERSDLLSLENNDNPLLYPTIAVLAHLGISNPKNFEQLMREFDYNIIDILTAINVRFNANLNIADDRLILVMLHIFGDNQIYNGEHESTENLSVLNQTNAWNFFQKVVDLIRNDKFNDYQKSLFFSSDDAIFDTELMSCPLSHLLNTLITDTQDFSISQSKGELLAFLEENGI